MPPELFRTHMLPVELWDAILKEAAEMRRREVSALIESFRYVPKPRASWQHKVICTTMRAEVPVIQTQAQTDLQAVRDVVVQYDETVQELLMKKWRLDEMQRDEAQPFAQPDVQPPLKLDAEKYKKICATIRAEVPFLQETVKTAINFSGFSQCVCSLIVSYAPRALPHTYAPSRAVGRDPQGSRGDAPT